MRDPLTLACPACGTLNRVPRARLADKGRCGQCRTPLFAGHPLTLTSETFARHAESSDLPLLIDFWAEWCGPCRVMAPVIEQAAEALEPVLRVAKLDTEAAPEIARRFAIQSIPTLMLMRHGKEIARTAGAMPLQRLLAWTRQHLAEAG
ncbi:MAG TPA: thioredoxin TrxC [Stellaceae bacterium]|nr:thioredoxin TrxC [Stellaceae bacterium]